MSVNPLIDKNIGPKMLTSCTECKHKFEIDDCFFAQLVKCPNCSHHFHAIWHIDKPSRNFNPLEEESDSEEDSQDSAGANTSPSRQRKRSKDIITEKVKQIESGFRAFLPRIKAALNNNENESNTRLLLDRILLDILGYTIENIKTEQRIQGRKADYVLSVDGTDVLVIEVKRVGLVLKDAQVFQATSYGAHAGIKWVLLTNVEVWKLYRISVGDKIEAHSVFALDFRGTVDYNDASYLYLLSKDGITKKHMLEKLWQKTSALSVENLVGILLSDEVISKIRTNILKNTGCKLTNDEIRSALEKDVLHFD